MSLLLATVWTWGEDYPMVPFAANLIEPCLPTG